MDNNRVEGTLALMFSGLFFVTVFLIGSMIWKVYDLSDEVNMTNHRIDVLEEQMRRIGDD